MLEATKAYLTGSTIERRVATEAIDFVYANLIDVSRLQMFFPIVIAVLYWPLVSHRLIIVWCAASIAIYLVRIALAMAYRKRDRTLFSPYRWGGYFTATSLVSGFFWGLSAWLFFLPEAESQQTLLYVLIVGTAAGAIIISAYWMVAYLAYTIPAISLISLNLFVRGDSDDAILGVMMLFYLVIVVGVARRVREQAYASIKLRFDNLDLVERLKEQKLEAERSNRAKTQFLAAANHDLRQPVNALTLFSYSIKSELVSEKGKSLYKSLSQAIENLSSLLSSLLDLSQLDAGALNVRHRVFSLESLAESLEYDYTSMASERNIALKFRVCRGGVRSDFVLLRRLIGNLLSNAIRNTHAGKVLVAFRDRGDTVLVQVWDTGVGIPDSEREDIFREFYQIANHQRDSKNGLGLGLAIATRIARLLDTRLELRSTVGKGTVFSFHIPAAPVSSMTVDDEPGFDASILRYKSALLIDDEKIGLDALSSVLTKNGMSVTQADTCERAEELVFDVGLRPDIIISDYRLPRRLNGLELIRRLRQHPALTETPAMLITGDTAVEVLQTLRDSGIPVLNKPVSATMLLHTLQDLLQTPEVRD